MRRVAILMTTLALMLSGLVFSPVHAAIPSDGTYLCTTGMPSSSTPNFRINNFVVLEGSSCSGAVVIPDGVTRIGNSAFAVSSISSITMPSSVTSIGDDAFSSARSLTSVTIPSSVTSIGVYAFASSGLTSITIPSSVISLGAGVFFDSVSLSSVTFLPGVTRIPDIMFEGATALTSVTIPSGVTSIGIAAFFRTALTSVTIPASVTSIELMAFQRASALGSVYFLGNAPSVGNDAFSNISSGAKAYIKSGATGFTTSGSPPLWNRLTITNVAADGTYLCTSGRASSSTPNFRITNFVVLEGSSCSGAVVIPDGVTRIGDNAFQGSSISSITIPSSVTSIGYAAFNAAWSLSSVTVPSSVTSIGDFAFASSVLTSFTIPSSVTVIGDFAFAFSELTSITIPSSVISLGEGVFFDSVSLSSVTFLPGVTRIPDIMFEGATALTSVTIPSGVTSIGIAAFHRTALTSVTIPASVTSIELMAFQRASALGSVYFLGNAPSVGNDAFSNISSGAKAYIKSGATGFTTSGSPPLWNGLIVEVVFDPPAPSPVINSAPAPVSNSAPAIETPAQVVDTGLVARTVSAKKKYSAKSLAKQIGIKMISPKATVSISAAKSSKKICTKSSARLRTLKAGNCVVTFTVQEPKPKKGKKPKATKTTTTLVVR